MLEQYKQQHPYLVALDSIILGFDGESLQVLLVKRGLAAETWSLMGGWLQPDETLDDAAHRILFELTGLSTVYLEQLSAFGDPGRDPVTRTVSVAYFALVNVDDHQTRLSAAYQPRWFSVYDLPPLLFDHADMVALALERLRYKAAHQPIGFELMPEKFTIPQLKKLYDAIYNTEFDKRNFSRKILSMGLLVKLNEKQKGFSKKGAYYYQLHRENYRRAVASLRSFIAG